jgi:glyoxylase-like metal-dependent hydrolase (beta-lactamase superfamily II)
MHVGNVSLRFVSDGIHWVDGGSFFGLVPKALWKPIVEPDERNHIPVHLRCLLIETGTHRFLVDTGCGDKLSEEKRGRIRLIGQRRLLGNLRDLGIEPQDVELVINTHLHGSHCGGNTVRGAGGQLVPTFPRATYCLQRLELADAVFPNERTQVVYHAENYQPLEQSGQLRLLWGDTRLTDQVRVVVTPGHTRAHQCVIVESGGQTAIFLGDAASWPINIERLTWVPAYDVEPLVSIETKRRLALWAVEKNALLLFGHHPEILAGYLHTTKRPDRFVVEPIEVAEMP